LIITNNYTPEGIEDTRKRFYEVLMEEYKDIYGKLGVPEKPEPAFE